MDLIKLILEQFFVAKNVKVNVAINTDWVRYNFNGRYYDTRYEIEIIFYKNNIIKVDIYNKNYINQNRIWLDYEFNLPINFTELDNFEDFIKNHKVNNNKTNLIIALLNYFITNEAATLITADKNKELYIYEFKDYEFSQNDLIILDFANDIFKIMENQGALQARIDFDFDSNEIKEKLELK